MLRNTQRTRLRRKPSDLTRKWSTTKKPGLTQNDSHVMDCESDVDEQSSEEETKPPKQRKSRWDVRDLGSVSIFTIKDGGFPYRDVPLSLVEGESVLGVTSFSPPAVPLPVSVFVMMPGVFPWSCCTQHAGIGGFSLGVPPSLTGYKLVAALAIEGDPTICESHRLTHPDIQCACHMLEDRDEALRIIKRFLPFRTRSERGYMSRRVADRLQRST